MRRSRHIWMLLPMLFGLEGILAAQTGLEYGLGASRAATGAAASKGAGAAVNAIGGSLDKVLKKGKEAADNGSSGVPPAADKAGQKAASGASSGGSDQQVIVVPMSSLASEPAVPSRVYEDAAGIQKGMANEELLQRFGPPSLDVAGSIGVRTLTYKGKSAMYELEMRDDKVAKVTAMNSHQSALVLPGGKE